MGECVAGVDCSTQATKVVCVDVETGHVLSSARAPHRVTRPAPGASETDPAEWEDALAGALMATRRAREVRAVSVAGQQHGLVVLGVGRRSSAAGGAVERHAFLFGGRGAAGAVRGGVVGVDDRDRAGGVVHGDEVGVAAVG